MPTKTATQKRAQAKAEYDAFLANCPSRQLLDRVSDKWVALILAALGSDRPRRYSELSRRLAGVSQKMLTQTLRSLRHLRADRPGAVPPTADVRHEGMGRGAHGRGAHQPQGVRQPVIARAGPR